MKSRLQRTKKYNLIAISANGIPFLDFTVIAFTLTFTWIIYEKKSKVCYTAIIKNELKTFAPPIQCNANKYVSQTQRVVSVLPALHQCRVSPSRLGDKSTMAKASWCL